MVHNYTRYKLIVELLSDCFCTFLLVKGLQSVKSLEIIFSVPSF